MRRRYSSRLVFMSFDRHVVSPEARSPAWRNGSSVLARFLGTWIDLQRKNGTIQALYDYWILGRDARPRQPRWLFTLARPDRAA